jgi:hypothetical protein
MPQLEYLSVASLRTGPAAHVKIPQFLNSPIPQSVLGSFADGYPILDRRSKGNGKSLPLNYLISKIYMPLFFLDTKTQFFYSFPSKEIFPKGPKLGAMK